MVIMRFIPMQVTWFVTDATRPEVTAKLTVNGVEPKSTPLEGGGKNYTIYAGDDAVVTFTATDDSGKLKK